MRRKKESSKFKGLLGSIGGRTRFGFQSAASAASAAEARKRIRRGKRRRRKRVSSPFCYPVVEGEEAKGTGVDRR
jgi:hypothetical protein